MERLREYLLAEDEEHREIERALHDTVQQRLVALAVALQTARTLVEEDPADAVRALGDARADIAQALDELRAIAQRVHPPLLDTQGLGAALRMAAAAAPVPTRVRSTVDGDVPPELAVTAYRFVVAALAGADGSATVAVTTRDGQLELDVEAASIDPRALDGVAGRFAVLAGTIEISPDRVSCRLPLPRPGT
ncbi:MAG TPA: histidine kinase [Gaiellaceae bacterium]|nr:histidine kinase [Gaiellaceae bacterium]